MANIRRQKKRVRISARERRGEPPLPLDGEDADEAARGRRRRRRHGQGRSRAPRAGRDGSTRPRRTARCTRTPPARKKSQRRPARRRQRRRPSAATLRSIEGSLELEVGRERAAALERVVELGETDDAVAQLVLGEVRRLAEQLLDVVRVSLQASTRRLRARMPSREETLAARSCAPGGGRARPPGAAQRRGADALALEDRSVASSTAAASRWRSRVGERERRHLPRRPRRARATRAPRSARRPPRSRACRPRSRRWWKSSPTSWTSAATASGCARDAVPA